MFESGYEIMDILNAIVALSNYVIVPGIAYGSQLALGALGVTLIYGILRFSNFAHGDTMAFGAMVTVLVTWWMQSVGISLGPLPTALLALPFGILATMALLLFTDRMVYRFYREQKAKPVILVIVSMGVMLPAEVSLTVAVAVPVELSCLRSWSQHGLIASKQRDLPPPVGTEMMESRCAINADHKATSWWS